MKLSFVLLFFMSCVCINLNAQDTKQLNETPSDTNLVALKILSTKMINGATPEIRKENCYKFIPALVNYLRKENSYNDNLDYINEISILNAPDNSFRIFTWNLEETISNTGNYKNIESEADIFANQLKYTYYGAIQFNSKELKLIPLNDKSAEIDKPEDLLLDSENWYGALYYNISEFSLNGEKCYALYGWDGNTGISEKKVMDILSFKNGEAIFGMPIIEVFRDDELSIKNRFVLEYRAGSGVSVNYDNEKALVIYDYIEPPEPESKGIYPTYIPDGTYNGLKFENGMWRFVKRVYKNNSISPEQLLMDRDRRLNEKRKNKKKWWKRNK